jgi:hypothetical protein
MKHSTNFGFDVPDDFPITELEAFHAAVTTHKDTHAVEWGEWAGGCNGISYRYLQGAAADEAFTASVAAHGTAPVIDERIAQENALFAFFAAGLSSLECLAYGLCFVGAIVDPAAFALTATPQRVWVSSLTDAYLQRFPQEQLAQTLQAVNTSPELSSFKDVRNVLTHRAAPGRAHGVTLADTVFVGGGGAGAPPGSSSITGTSWLGQPLDSQTTAAPRTWLAGALTEIVSAATTFASGHL